MLFRSRNPELRLGQVQASWEEALNQHHPQVQYHANEQDDTVIKQLRIMSESHEYWQVLTLPSPCNPSILLKITSIDRGSIPAVPVFVPPWTVYVFPEFVTPYVKSNAF